MAQSQNAFTSGLELIAQEMSQPLAREFRITYEQQNLGLPLREALNNLARRIPLSDVRIFVALLQIQQDSGGNLAEMLNNLSQVIRERFKLLRQVRVYTAEGRLSMIVLTALPPVAALLFLLTNPEYLRPTDSIAYALNMMSIGGYRHVPLVDNARVPVGVISVKDLVGYIVRFFPKSVMNLPTLPRGNYAQEREGP